MTTKEAFEKLTEKRNWYVPMGVNQKTANWLKFACRKGTLREETMEKYLEIAGFKPKSQKKWKI